jgi:integrase
MNLPGVIKELPKGKFQLIFDLPPTEPVLDPQTGAPVLNARREVKMKRRQKWVVFEPPPGTSPREARKLAEAKLTELLDQKNKGTYIDVSKTTVLEYLRTWLEKTVRPVRRSETARVYANFIEKHVAPSRIAHLPLQKLRKSDLEHFYNVDLAKLSPSSVTVCHAILSKALNDAVDDGLLPFNPAARAKNRRKVERGAAAESAQKHCWSALEARKVLDVAKVARPQMSAFVALALDTGARKSELYGLLWADVDLDAGTVYLRQQLDRAGAEPVFGPLKTKRCRNVTLDGETVNRLKAHKRYQAELKMANRTVYRDFGLVFAKEPEHLQMPKAELGQPLKSLDGKPFRDLVRQAGVRPIKFHGLRHTCVTLSLAAGVPVNAVAQRVGHVEPTMTLNVYGHVLDEMQKDAAAKLGAVLFG